MTTTLHDIAGTLAVALTTAGPDVWTRDPKATIGTHHAALQRTRDKARIGIRFESQERLSLSGACDPDLHKFRDFRNVPGPCIRVSATREPAVIVREIQRRLLPGLEQVVIEASARAQGIRNGKTAAEAVAARLRATGAALSSGRQDDEMAVEVGLRLVGASEGTAYGSLRARSNGTVDLDLRGCPLPAVEAFLRALKEEGKP